MGYASLVWMGSAYTCLRRSDHVQSHSVWICKEEGTLDSLIHCRRISEGSNLYKIQHPKTLATLKVMSPPKLDLTSEAMTKGRTETLASCGLQLMSKLDVHTLNTRYRGQSHIVLLTSGIIFHLSYCQTTSILITCSHSRLEFTIGYWSLTLTLAQLFVSHDLCIVFLFGFCCSKTWTII